MLLMKSFYIALFALTLVHSAVSLGAYRFLAKTTVECSRDIPAIDTTTPEQRAAGQSTLTLSHWQAVTREIPTPVVFYMWAGYIGLAAAAFYAVYFRLRHG